MHIVMCYHGYFIYIYYALGQKKNGLSHMYAFGKNSMQMFFFFFFFFFSKSAGILFL